MKTTTKKFCGEEIALLKNPLNFFYLLSIDTQTNILVRCCFYSFHSFSQLFFFVSTVSRSLALFQYIAGAFIRHNYQKWCYYRGNFNYIDFYFIFFSFNRFDLSMGILRCVAVLFLLFDFVNGWFFSWYLSLFIVQLNS